MFKYFQKNTRLHAGTSHSPLAFSRLSSTVYCLFALVLPFSLHIATGAMYLSLGIALLAAYRLPANIQRPPTVLLLPVIFFILHAIALTYTSNLQAGGLELLSKSCFLIFPIAIWLCPPSKETVQRILVCFVMSCLLVSLVCFVRSLINYHQIGIVSWLGYTWLSSQMGFLPVYLSLYIGFSFFIVLNTWIINAGKSSVWLNIGKGLALLFSLYIIVMLGARLISVAFLMLFIGAFLMWMHQRKMLFRGTIAMLVFTLGLWKLMDSFFVTRVRMNKIIGKQLNNYDHNFFININDPRGQIWESCFAAIERMSWWGYGIGGEVERVLLQIYDLKNYHHLLLVLTDSHNQYLQTFLSLGYVGLICLVLMLSAPLYLSWKRKNYLYVLFSLLMTIPMLTECMLEAAHGLMYFSFFNSVLSAALLVNTQNSSNILR